MSSSAPNKPILFPARSSKDSNGHGSSAFSFGSNDGLMEPLSQMLFGSTNNSRAFFEKATATARENMTTTADLFLALQTGVRQWNEKIFSNSLANTEAALTAAKAMSSVHRMEDVARLQNDFFQKQLSSATEQSKELFQLSNQIFQKTFAAFHDAAMRTLQAPLTFK